MKPEALPGRQGGFIVALAAMCWLLGHDWYYRDGRGHLVCLLCKKVT